MKIIAIQGNKLEQLNLQSDTSLFIASQMIKYEYRIFWYEPHHMSYSNNQLIAYGCYITVQFCEKSKQPLTYVIDSFATLDLFSASCIIVRQDPPVNIEYLHSLNMLSLLKNKMFIFNDLFALRTEVEKLLPIRIASNATPYTIISNDFHQIKEFLKQHQTIVLKPIYGYGGQEVIKATTKIEIENYLKKFENMQIIAQEFLPQIYDGDKRIIVYEGKILGVIGRNPEKGNFITNTCAGGQLYRTKLSNNEKTICEGIALKLQEKNIFFAGIDMIGDYVTEINITSPTLLVGLAILEGMNCIKPLFNTIDQKIKSFIHC